MQVFYSTTHRQHQPPYEIWNGEQDQHQEVPGRFETIFAALQQDSTFQLREVSEEVPSELLMQVHDRQYLEFVEGACQGISNEGFLYPSVFGLRASRSVPTNARAKLGYYAFDMYTPLLAGTWRAALGSASAAYQAAQLVREGSLAAYALCRPPGHHAEPNQMGGYCYLNNSAVAAQYLVQFGKVAVLDVDFHHGNGTQHIFYDRDDVLTVSIHADPQWKFPHMSGFEDERGRRKGRGYNRNFVLGEGTTDEQYAVVLDRACQVITEFSPDFLVVAFGADTHAADPIGGFQLTTEYFQEMGRTLLGLKRPTVIVQEGGYNTSLLGENVRQFLKGFGV